MGNDEVAFPPRCGQSSARWPNVFLRLALESTVDGFGVSCRSVGVDDLSDDRVTVGTVGVGVGAWMRVVGAIDVNVTGEFRGDAKRLKLARDLVAEVCDAPAAVGLPALLASLG